MTSVKAIQKLNLIIDNEEISKNIEKSIYNYAYEQCKSKNIEPDIENKYFKRIYVNKLMSLYNNLDKNSYIKNESFLEVLQNEEGLISKIDQKILFITTDSWLAQLGSRKSS